VDKIDDEGRVGTSNMSSNLQEHKKLWKQNSHKKCVVNNNFDVTSKKHNNCHLEDVNKYSLCNY